MNTVHLQELSSNVLLELRVNGHVLRVGQICDKVLFLREPRETPSGDAELLITVDGETSTYRIFLPHGIDSRSDAVEFF
jgi:hypothetical protein